MSLSDVERRILLNQYKILSALFPAEAEQYDRLAQILNEGYHDRWSDVVYGDMKEPLPKEETDFVFDVLVMYDWLQKSYFSLPKPERFDFDEKQLRFPGFDAGGEKRLGAYARFLAQRMERFTFLNAVPGMVCGSSMRAAYGRMLAAMPKLEENRSLTAYEIRHILDALVKRPALSAKLNRSISPTPAPVPPTPVPPTPVPSASIPLSPPPAPVLGSMPALAAAPSAYAPPQPVPSQHASPPPLSTYGAPINSGQGRGAASATRGALALKPAPAPALPHEVFAHTPELAAFEAALNASLAREAFQYFRE